MRFPCAPIFATLAACTAVTLAVPAGAGAARTGHAHRHGHHGASAGRHGRSHCARHGRSRNHSSGRDCVAALRRASAGAARKQHHHAPSRAAASADRAAAARAATIARVLATPCENTQITPEAGNLEAARAAVDCLINRERAQNGDLPLKVDSRLQSAAQSHVEELVADDYFAHVSPSGYTPVDRIRATGYIPGPEFGYLIGENLAWGTLTLSTPQAIVEAWMASPDHRANILEGRYVDTGIGIAPAVPASLSGGSQGATYGQEFGTIIS